MNFIYKLYSKIKTSWDNYWIEWEQQMSELSSEEQITIMNNFKGEQL